MTSVISISCCMNPRSRITNKCHRPKGIALCDPLDRDLSTADNLVVTVIDDMPFGPFGKRAFREHIDHARDGSEIVDAVADHIRAEFLRRIGLGDFLTPRVNVN
jgi:predicted RNA methylase